MGGATAFLRARYLGDFGVSIAEAILWGEQHYHACYYDALKRVSIAEAILWGEQRLIMFIWLQMGVVSIAEAILWGEQLAFPCPRSFRKSCFNRRGDSLGGATETNSNVPSGITL